MPPPFCSLVLITGASGHIGYATLVQALTAGYQVRAAVRSQAKASLILSRPQIKAINPGPRLEFAIVRDITRPDAYEHAIEGVDYVIHIASPLVTGDQVPLSQHQEFFIKPAVRGTIGMLEAARRSRTVQRVVITSSIVALMPVAHMEGVERRTRPVHPDDRPDFIEQPYESEFTAYAASKVAALHAAEAWIAKEDPDFDVVHLHPGFVLGKNELATTAVETMKGTNAVVLAMLLGKKFGPYAGATVHVQDVARVHVKALMPTIPGNESYILSQPARWNDAKEIAKHAFPEAFERRVLTGAGNVDTAVIPIDSSLTERIFGIRLQTFESQVESTVGHFLELRNRKKVQPMSHGAVSRDKCRPRHLKASA
jgi:nucleoside-diphosphate-sugar epimerase